MEILITVIGGIGIGSLLNTLLVFWSSQKKERKEKLYQEKREAYLGLLRALHQAAVEPSDRHSKDFALWKNQCDLFGSNDVSRAIQGIIDTNDGPREHRNKYFEELIDYMREDLSYFM